MENRCPRCENKIITMENREGMKCSICEWYVLRPDPPTAPPPRKMKDYFGLMVEVNK